MISKHRLNEFKVGLRGVSPIIKVFDEIYEHLNSLDKEIEKIKNHLNIKD
ncbi:MAG: hypothetical protein KAJ51_09490 [Thermoplasmata archaeon]|nr:hypothetical protein [Thermoplasmata archaeon]